MGIMKLTPRQQAAIVGIGQGLTVKEIARRLQISAPSVYRDLTDAANRLKLKNRTMAMLVTRAADLDIVSPEMRLSPAGYLTVTPKGAVRGNGF